MTTFSKVFAEPCDDGLSGFPVEINHHVAAEDDVELPGHIPNTIDQIDMCERHPLAQFRDNAEGSRLPPATGHGVFLPQAKRNGGSQVI